MDRVVMEFIVNDLQNTRAELEVAVKQRDALERAIVAAPMQPHAHHTKLLDIIGLDLSHVSPPATDANVAVAAGNTITGSYRVESLEFARQAGATMAGLRERIEALEALAVATDKLAEGRADRITSMEKKHDDWVRKTLDLSTHLVEAVERQGRMLEQLATLTERANGMADQLDVTTKLAAAFQEQIKEFSRAEVAKVITNERQPVQPVNASESVQSVNKHPGDAVKALASAARDADGLLDFIFHGYGHLLTRGLMEEISETQTRLDLGISGVDK